MIGTKQPKPKPKTWSERQHVADSKPASDQFSQGGDGGGGGVTQPDPASERRRRFSAIGLARLVRMMRWTSVPDIRANTAA